MKVIKFGGSSIKDAICINNVTNIILKHDCKLVVVFSATGDTTERLIEMYKSAEHSNDYLNKYNDFDQAIKNILTAINISYDVISNLMADLLHKLEDIHLKKELCPKKIDDILSFGEIITNIILFSYIKNNTAKKVSYLDSREIIITDSNHLNANYLASKSNVISDKITNLDFDVLILPGFIGSDINGNTTTLGRGGSDYTASIIGSSIHADIIEICSDADGILTANPKIVYNAKLITTLSYQHAYEISYYGGKILYHKTLKPAYQAGIPISIKNTFNYNCAGTLISNKSDYNDDILGITNLDGLTLFKLIGLNFKENVGISRRLFGSISKVGANIYFISQSSSETCINFCVNSTMADIVKKSIYEEFAEQVSDISLKQYSDKSIIAIIIKNRNISNGVLSKFFNAFNNKISFDLINQSDLSIDCIVDTINVEYYVQMIHDYFIVKNEPVSQNQLKYVYVLGFGNIGKKVTEHLLLNNNIILLGVANSKHMYFEDGDIYSKNKISLLENNIHNGDKMDISQIVKRLVNFSAANKYLIDVTASNDIPKYYKELSANNIKVIASNKKGFADDINMFDELKPFFRKNILFETTVGSRLPIIDTIQKLVLSGNTIKSIKGILSGTINYILSKFSENDINLSAIVNEAHLLGYTEPNPYDDLSGMDVARKILILARLAGYRGKLADVTIENLAFDIDGNTKEDFFNTLYKLDNKYNKLKQDAATTNCKLKYIASFNDNEINVSLNKVNETSPFYNINYNNNIVIIETDRSANPIIITGSGAGIEETADGVYTDILAS